MTAFFHVLSYSLFVIIFPSRLMPYNLFNRNSVIK